MNYLYLPKAIGVERPTFQERKIVFKNGIIIASLTMLSRIMGLIRETAMGIYFGVSSSVDAFNSSFRVANLFRQLLGEGALGNTFIPIYNKKEKEKGKDEAKKLIFSVLNVLFIFLIILTILQIVFAEEIMSAIASGFSPAKNLLSAELLRIMSVYILFIGMSGMIGSILNNFKQFIIPASTSLLFNFAMIGAAVIYKDKFGIYPIAWGVTIGGFLQLLIVLPSFFKTFGAYSFRVDRKDPYLKEIFINLMPMLIGVFGWQINVIVGQTFASYLPDGAMSALAKANSIYLLPLGVFGTTISTLIFPAMSRATAAGDTDSVKKSINGGLKLVAFLVVPSTIAFTALSNDIVKVIFGYGKFDKAAIIITAQCLLFYSFGLIFNNGMQILTRVFYSYKNTKDPARFSIISIVITIVISFIVTLTVPLNYRHMALAFVSSLTSAINFIQLYRCAEKKYFKFDNKAILTYTMKAVIIGLIALVPTFFLHNAILRIVAFSLVYLALWAKPLLKGGLNEFR